MGSYRRESHVHSRRLRYHLRSRRELHRLPGASRGNVAELHDRQPGHDGRRRVAGGGSPARCNRSRTSPVKTMRRTRTADVNGGTSSTNLALTVLSHQDVRHLYNRSTPTTLKPATGVVSHGNYGDIGVDIRKAKYDAVMLSELRRDAWSMTYTLGWPRRTMTRSPIAFAFRSSSTCRRPSATSARVVLSELPTSIGLADSRGRDRHVARPRHLALVARIATRQRSRRRFLRMAARGKADGLPIPISRMVPQRGPSLGKSLFPTQGKTMASRLRCQRVQHDKSASVVGRRPRPEWKSDMRPPTAHRARRAQVGARSSFKVSSGENGCEWGRA